MMRRAGFMSSHSDSARLTAYPFQDASDVTRIVDFVRSVRPVTLWTEYPSLYDIPELLSLPVNRGTVRVWRNNRNQMVGYAYVDAFQTLRFDVDWRSRDDELEYEIVAWGNECLKGRHPILYSTSHETDSERLAFFDRHQFLQCAETIIHMECSLDLDFPPPPVPDGFTIRAVRGEDEAAEIAALHRAAFQTSHMSAERRINMMRSNNYDPTLDLIAVASDGKLAAYALGQYSEPESEQGICYADLFATHPDYRGRGLARVMMYILVKRLQRMGYRIAKLSTDSNNHAMQQVAYAVGFQRSGSTLRFQYHVG